MNIHLTPINQKILIYISIITGVIIFIFSGLYGLNHPISDLIFNSLTLTEYSENPFIYDLQNLLGYVTPAIIIYYCIDILQSTYKEYLSLTNPIYEWLNPFVY